MRGGLVPLPEPDCARTRTWRAAEARSKHSRRGRRPPKSMALCRGRIRHAMLAENSQIPDDPKLVACVRMRVVDRSVLKLIRMWLTAPVVEPADDEDDSPVT